MDGYGQPERARGDLQEDQQHQSSLPLISCHSVPGEGTNGSHQHCTDQLPWSVATIPLREIPALLRDGRMRDTGRSSLTPDCYIVPREPVVRKKP